MGIRNATPIQRIPTLGIIYFRISTNRLLKYCLTHPENTILQQYFLRKSLMFGSTISRRTAKKRQFPHPKTVFQQPVKAINILSIKNPTWAGGCVKNSIA
jgi:hypothetical protein